MNRITLGIKALICGIFHIYVLPRGSFATYHKPKELHDICQWHTFNATCPYGEVIIMDQAYYGRMKLGTCIQRNYLIGCSGNVLKHTDVRCSGRHNCTIKIPDEHFHEVQPCPEDILAYMEASYYCVPVVMKERRICQTYKPLPITESSGYLSSSITEGSGLGTSFCPWVIKAPKGQRVNLTLYDFNTMNYDIDSNICQVYATVKERSRTRDQTVCAGTDRIRHIMLSDGNELEISIVKSNFNREHGYFILKYDAIGCADIIKPKHGWIKRNGNTITVGCNGTTDIWHLVCKEGNWFGEYNNCTQGNSPWILGSSFRGESAFPYGLLISVAIGVVLGVVFGTFMLFMVLSCRKLHIKKLQKDDTLLHEETMKSSLPPIPSQERTYATGQKIIPKKISKDSKGDYAHIWELRQGLAEDIMDHINENCQPLPPPPEISPYNIDEHSGVSMMPRNHMYESPKSSQDFIAMKDRPYYHEFDANVIDMFNKPFPNPPPEVYNACHNI